MEPRCWVTVQWITLSKLSLYKEDPKAMATMGDKIPRDTCVIALIFGAFKMEFLTWDHQLIQKSRLAEKNEGERWPCPLSCTGKITGETRKYYR